MSNYAELIRKYGGDISLIPSKYRSKALLPFVLTTALVLVSASSALADWRKDLGTFRIGIIEQAAKNMSPAELGKIRDAYSQALSMPVEIIQMRDFPALIDAQASSRVEYAMYSAAAYATAWVSCECVEPLVAPINADGSSASRTVLYLDKSVSLSAVAASKGIAVSGADSLTGFGVPLAEFSSGGAALKGNEPWLRFTPNMEAAVTGIKDNSADGLFAAIPVAGNAAAASANQIIATGRSLMPVWQSQPVPYGPQAIRRNLNPETKELLKNFLVALPSSNPELFDLIADGDAAKFEPISANAYLSTIKAVKALAEFSKLPKP